MNENLPELLAQYANYKAILLKNPDFPYNNPTFNELITFIRQNIDVLYHLMKDEHLVVWNAKGGNMDKLISVLGMLIYNNDDFYPRIVRTRFDVAKPSIIVKYVCEDGSPRFF